jgi:guanylate kinase
MDNYVLIVLIGSSERYVIAEELKRKFGYTIIPTETTRLRRENEATDEIVFVSQTKYKAKINADKYLDTFTQNGSSYGFDKNTILKRLSEGNCVICVQDPFQFHGFYKDCMYCFVLDSIESERQRTQKLISTDIPFVDMTFSGTSRAAEKIVSYICNKL